MPTYGMHIPSGDRLVVQPWYPENLLFSTFNHQHQRQTTEVWYQKIGFSN